MTKEFGAHSTTDEVLAGLDLSGKHVLVTGVSAGLGVETARALTAHGAQVTGTARDLAKAKRATAGIANLDLIELDLASLASVRACAEALLAAGKPFDVIIANAGVMATPQGRTADGFETQFGTNHLGHFVLVNRLLPLMKRGSRVVILSSAGHRREDVNLEDPGYERTEYEPFGAYGRSKTANILFAVELDRRLKSKGIRAAAVHPGGIMTELGRHLSPETLQRIIDSVNEAARAAGDPEHSFKSVPQGAATSVWTAVTADADAVGGRYCENCHVAETAAIGDQRALGVRPYAIDPDRAKALWALSEKMVGEAFPEV